MKVTGITYSKIWLSEKKLPLGTKLSFGISSTSAPFIGKNENPTHMGIFLKVKLPSIQNFKNSCNLKVFFCEIFGFFTEIYWFTKNMPKASFPGRDNLMSAKRVSCTLFILFFHLFSFTTKFPDNVHSVSWVFVLK